ncbi:hypothetical protein BYT27DRAFT_7125292 [Phlegmacium glaucopus]|nr:hypothetical protein BYT27DRAFT_7125292 [Phlegmacium glaucopus]
MELTAAADVWAPIIYDTSKPPTLGATLDIESDPEFLNNFPRNAKWSVSPDGSVLLAQCENNTLQVINILLHSAICKTARLFNQPAPILDFIWYPTATPLDPASFCFIASVRECPVKLLDASDGRLRASYRIVDHRERQIAPHSLSFNPTAHKLYCGFEDAIEIFDLSRPGEGTRLHTTPSKKSKDGLKGIISAITFSPSYNGEGFFYAAGSFSPTSSNIAMFSDQQEHPLMFVQGGPRAGLQFNPTKPHILYAAYRGSANGSVYSWDIRSHIDSPLEIFTVPSTKSHESTGLASYETTRNQKMRFDIDPFGQLLSIGDQVGNISIFDLAYPEVFGDEGHEAYDINDAQVRGPKLWYKAHNDAVGATVFHPLMPSLLSGSGSRHFLEDDDDDDSSSDEESTPINNQATVRRRKRPRPVTVDPSIKIWDFGPSGA